MFFSDKKFNQYMENVNKAYVLLAEHIEVLEYRLSKVDNSSYESAKKEFDEKQTEKLNSSNEEEINN